MTEFPAVDRLGARPGKVSVCAPLSEGLSRRGIRTLSLDRWLIDNLDLRARRQPEDRGGDEEVFHDSIPQIGWQGLIEALILSPLN